jgi:hypothetical protein
MLAGGSLNGKEKHLPVNSSLLDCLFELAMKEIAEEEKNRDVVFKHLNTSQLKIRVVVRFRPHPHTTSRLLQDIYVLIPI